MLTNDDLNKIGQIIDEKLDNKFDLKLKPLKNDLKKIRKDLEFVVGSLDKQRWNLEQKFDSHVSHPPKAFAT